MSTRESSLITVKTSFVYTSPGCTIWRDLILTRVRSFVLRYVKWKTSQHQNIFSSHLRLCHSCITYFRGSDKHYWQFNYGAPLTEGYNIFNCRPSQFWHNKNRRKNFWNFKHLTVNLEALCDISQWGKNDVRRKYSKWTWKKVWPGAS